MIGLTHAAAIALIGAALIFVYLAQVARDGLTTLERGARWSNHRFDEWEEARARWALVVARIVWVLLYLAGVGCSLWSLYLVGTLL